MVSSSREIDAIGDIMPREEIIFKPRDFIYINDQKLDSYFSQLFGGLIQNIDVSEANDKENTRKGSISSEAFLKFGLGKNTAKLADFILSQIGNFEASIKGNLQGEITNKKTESSLSSSRKTLEHFKYTLFEESLKDLGYLIDLDNFILKNPQVDAGTIRGALKSADFIKFKATSIEMSDYRNASSFINLAKRIIDLSAEVLSGEVLDIYAKQAATGLMATEMQELIKVQSYALLGSKLPGGAEPSLRKGKIIQVIVKAVDEAFSGNLIPLDVLLTAHVFLKRRGELIFESQLKDEFFLEQRTDIAFKYGYFEDANWTIVRQITSLKSAKSQNVNDSIAELKKKIEEEFAKKEKLNINLFVKTLISEIDLLSKKLGLLPLIGQQHVAFTPIAIYREPQINAYFS